MAVTQHLSEQCHRHQALSDITRYSPVRFLIVQESLANANVSAQKLPI